MGCDLCGKEGEMFPVVIEGSTLQACKTCSSLGERKAKVSSKPKKKENKGFDIEEEVESLVDGFGFKVREARENMGLSQGDMAAKLAEKESLLQKVESGVEPSMELARKLEKKLNLKLLEKKKVSYDKKKSSDEGELTLGDMVDIKKKKK